MFIFCRFLFFPFVPVVLCAWVSSPGRASDQTRENDKPPSQAEDKDKIAKEPDAAAIARLVKQLGSSDFRERETATKALAAIGLPALEALRNASKDIDVEVAQRATRLVTSIENGFDQ